VAVAAFELPNVDVHSEMMATCVGAKANDDDAAYSAEQWCCRNARMSTSNATAPHASSIRTMIRNGSAGVMSHLSGHY
jgi:hypothetical protein